MQAREGFIPNRRWRTWYRILGDLDSQIPLVLLHGGPGVPHQSLEPLEAFAATGRPLVFYDQLGCGESDRPEDPEEPERFQKLLEEFLSSVASGAAR